MFPQVSPSLFALDFASLATIVFCAPFVFMVLRIASTATPLDSHLYKLPGGVGVNQAKPSAECLASCRLPGLGAIIPLCTPNIRRCAFLSLADCHCFSWG